MGRNHRFWVLVAMLAAGPTTAQSQGLVVRDGSLGEGPFEVGPGTDPLGYSATYLITPEMGEQSGSNLFHSFESFGIGTGETATFTGPDPVEGPQSVSNVISRVTGGSESQIDGTLRSTIPGADLWLINPSGVMFGEGARLDVPGSFHASTGDYVGFEGDLVRFYADPSRPSVLSTARPEAFGFLGERAPEPISVTGATLAVPGGETLELVGGDVTLTHTTLDAPAGSISIRGGRILVENGLVDARAAGEDAAGTISVAATESVVVDRGFLLVDAFGTGDAGTLTIGAESVTVAGGGLGASTGEGLAGHIGIDARFVEVSDSFVYAGAFGDGAGGTIDIDADELIMRGISPAKGMDVGTHGSGKGGTITIGDVATPLRSLTLSEGGYVSAVGYGSGDAGSITIAADSLLVHGASPAVGSNIGVGTQGGGNAGTITIDADSLVIGPGGFIDAGAGGSSGDAGHITIDADSVITDQGIITAGTSGTGAAGRIDVTASESILLTGAGGPRFSLFDILVIRQLGLPPPLPITGIFSVNGSGSITLKAQDITLTDGAIVSTATIGGGDAGDVLLSGDRIYVRDGAFVDSTSLPWNGQPGGNVGNVTLEANERIEVVGSRVGEDDGVPFEDVSHVTSASLGTGAGGTVALRAPRILIDGGAVATTALPSYSGRQEGSGGNISVNAGELIVRGGGRIDASSFVPGPGGAIDITASDSIVVEGKASDGTASGISSRTGGDGVGGEILLRAPEIEVSEFGEISAKSEADPAKDPGFEQEVGRIFDSLIDDVFLIGKPPTEATDDAGSVTIEAKDLVHLDAGTITASVNGGPETTGGNIFIDPEVVVLQNDSRIEARAGEGSGGNIQITAENYFAFPGSIVSVEADSELGIDGTVEISAPDVDLAGKITTLPTTPLDAASLMKEACAARRSGERAGSFAVRGNGGIPAEPDGWLPAAVSFEAAAGSSATSDLPAGPGGVPLFALGSCR